MFEKIDPYSAEGMWKTFKESLAFNRYQSQFKSSQISSEVLFKDVYEDLVDASLVGLLARGHSYRAEDICDPDRWNGQWDKKLQRAAAIAVWYLIKRGIVPIESHPPKNVLGLRYRHMDY